MTVGVRLWNGKPFVTSGIPSEATAARRAYNSASECMHPRPAVVERGIASDSLIETKSESLATFVGMNNLAMFTKDFLAEGKLLAVRFFAPEFAGDLSANSKRLSPLEIRDARDAAVSSPTVLFT